MGKASARHSAYGHRAVVAAPERAAIPLLDLHLSSVRVAAAVVWFTRPSQGALSLSVNQLEGRNHQRAKVRKRERIKGHGNAREDRKPKREEGKLLKVRERTYCRSPRAREKNRG